MTEKLVILGDKQSDESKTKAEMAKQLTTEEKVALRRKDDGGYGKPKAKYGVVSISPGGVAELILRLARAIIIANGFWGWKNGKMCKMGEYEQNAEF